MVTSIEAIRSHNVSLIQSRPLVAVFTGATAGIGSYAAQALAAHGASGKGLRLYIVGRNQSAAGRITAECQKVCPKGEFRFVQTEDLALMGNVDRVCEEIIALEKGRMAEGERPVIDLLVMTQGYLAFERNETKEGLDALMSLLYYSRMRTIMQLLPLLLSSPQPAHIISVFGPQRNDRIFVDDLSLRDPKHYGFMNMGSHVAYLTTFFMENLAAKYPGQLALVHYFPGLVVTESFQSKGLPTWFKVAWKLVGPLSPLFAVPKMESGERVLFLASARFPPRGKEGETADAEAKKIKEDSIPVAVSSDGAVGGGAYRVDWNGEIMPMKKSYLKLREQGMSEKCWSYTMRAFEEIEAGKVFEG